MTPARPPGRGAIVALGSNLGDSRRILVDCLDELRRRAPDGFVASSLWRSTPVECPPGSPDFLNAVCRWDVGPHFPTPESLLDQLQSLERDFGRRPRKVLNESRPLDLDLIAFGDAVRNGPRLVLPHPRAHQRRFVLAPLHEIDPGLVLPGWTRTVAELLSDLPAGRGDEVHRLP
ncbi:MAG: 2-amino-4-hydroxy-6-hydroxymethyldihydropteridine diphosphokinase [Limisphaerales bacterium]